MTLIRTIAAAALIAGVAGIAPSFAQGGGEGTYRPTVTAQGFGPAAPGLRAIPDPMFTPGMGDNVVLSRPALSLDGGTARTTLASPSYNMFGNGNG